ncbi:hypothetical protein HT031_000698 [Scenedesmus sp. PABB004]|nr:hypothetical protein HT031_000698 [Scenedesmus sp. PABB004]
MADAFCFGSPLQASHGGPGTPDSKLGNGARTPQGGAVDNAMQHSPLLFRRTPGGLNATPADSGKRFSDWVMCTSPYAGQKTPPTASMASARPGDENTPPPTVEGREQPDRSGAAPRRGGAGPEQGAAAPAPRALGAHARARAARAAGGSAHFQAWLAATGSAKWTPRRSPAGATPPRAPAPSPAAGTPMSTVAAGLPRSAVSPASAQPRSRPLFDLGPADAGSEDGDDGDDGGSEAATTVGAHEVAAATARAALACGGAAAARAPPRTPPRAPAPTPVGSSPAAAGSGACEAGGDALATPLSQLGLGGRPRPTPGRGAGAPPGSPVGAVIELMLEGQTPRGAQQSRLGAAPPPSPEQQVIRLMLAAQGGGDGAPQPGSPTAGLVAGARGGSDDGDGRGDGACGAESSDDDIDAGELLALCGARGAPGTPLSDIIGMLATPALRPTPGVAAALGAGGDGVGPRVLLFDD